MSTFYHLLTITILNIKVDNLLFFFFYFTDCVLALKELICFPTLKGKVNLADEIGCSYWKFGVLLLDDDSGKRISAIELEYRHNAERIVCRVFQLWLEGKGKQPVTWSTLVTVLQDIDLNLLAKCISDVKLQ